MDGNRSTQSSHSKSHNVILNPTSPPNTTVPPPVDSASASPTPPSDSDTYHLSQTPVYCPQPEWPESNDFNTFTNPVSTNPAPWPASISEPQPPTYHPQPEWSEPNDFNPLQTPHPQFSCSFPHQLLSLIRSRTGPNQTTSTPGQSLLQAQRSRHGPNPAASHKLPLVASIKLGLGTTTFNIHWAIL